MLIHTMWFLFCPFFSVALAMRASSGRALVAFGLLACASAQQRGYGYQDEVGPAGYLRLRSIQG